MKKHLLHLALATLVRPAFGQENHISNLEVVPRLATDDIASVKVALMMPGVYLSSPMRESDLFRSQCVFASDNSEKIHSIINILENFIELPARSRVDNVELRNAIYLNKKDGSQVKFLMSDSVEKNIVNGTMYSNSYGTPFLGSGLLLKNLRGWAKHDVELAGGRPKDYCDAVRNYTYSKSDTFQY
jgi:hypothetical protein